MTWRDPPQPILTPCVGVCALDSQGFCAGCHRTRDEIAVWSALSQDERSRIMREVLPQRESIRVVA